MGIGAAMLVLVGTVVVVLLGNRSEQSAPVDGTSPAASTGKTMRKGDFVDLSAYYTMPASAWEESEGSGRPQWSCIPRGFQTFLHVPLQIDGIKCLWGSGLADANFDEEVKGIPVNRKFETLYVYHAAFYGTPPKTPVYDLVFRYADGSSVTNTMLYGVDVLDWFGTGGPTGPNSKLAWKAVCTAGGKTQPLRFCLTALKNPQPLNEVTTIDLYSCKNRTVGCILAMTPGKAGMMRE